MSPRFLTRQFALFYEIQFSLFLIFFLRSCVEFQRAGQKKDDMSLCLQFDIIHIVRTADDKDPKHLKNHNTFHISKDGM